MVFQTELKLAATPFQRQSPPKPVVATLPSLPNLPPPAKRNVYQCDAWIRKVSMVDYRYIPNNTIEAPLPIVPIAVYMAPTSRCLYQMLETA